MSNSMEARPLTSAFESPTFGEDSTFHVEQPVGSMSISPCGRDVVLASKEGLHIIDLDSPYSPPRYLPHHTPWEVADVQWSPFAARDYWVVSTSNQKALVWNLAMNTPQNSIEHVLHAHSRAITDINFSAHHPDVIATCSVDSFVHSWDLRTPSRPAITFSDWFAGATQVKWNRQDPHVIASSHDRFLRIWDDRMGAIPIRSIEAHNTKIYGVDWNRVRPGALVTCSLDRTVKFWDYTAERDVPEKLIKTPFPVWRARNTPFGWGVLAMPQRGNSDLHLYSRRSGEEPGPTTDELPLVHSFPGHKGQVKEFLWRPRGGVVNETDHREFQLVSWGSDKELRLHRVQPDVLRRVGYEKGKSFIHNLNVTRSGAVYKTFRDGQEDLDGTGSGLSTGSQPRFPDGTGVNNTISMPYSRTWGGNVDSRVGMRGKTTVRTETNPIAWMRGVKIAGWDIETLGDEISHVGEKFTKVVFESVDVRQRKATISLHGPWGADSTSLFLKADIKFPVEYPRASIPVFNIQKTAAVTDQLAARLVLDLKTIAESYLSRKRGCLEGVVRYLLGESTLDESIAWIQGETAETVKSPVNGGLGGDDSSDEDEVGLSHSQDLGMSSELLRPVNANVMVPVAKVCGALWANDGRLVCFFPPKKDKSATMLETLGFKEMTRMSRSDKVFEGFGRLQTASPGPRITGTIASTDDGVSEYSDDSDTESSSSSGSSDMLSSGLPARFPAPQTWRSAGSLGFHRPRSTDNSQRSIGGSGHVKPSEASQTVVSIHDLSSLLPAKRELASKYRICGKSADVCAYNASVALDSGYHELAQIWGLVKLILLNQQSPGFQSEHGNFQRRPFRSTQRKDSAVDMSFDAPNPIQFLNGAARKGLQWGNHPFGRSWLIPALFDHFERIGDVQMVAMLSCVLHESNSEGNLTRDQCGYGGLIPRRTEPLSSLDAPSETAAAQSKSQEAITPVGSAPKESHMSSAAQSSGRSSSETWRGTSPPYSTGTTPPATSRPGAISADRKHVSQTVSIATSPDQQSQPRSGSGIGSVLASSLSRSFTFGPSSASPPTSVFGRKKQSPSGSPNAPIAWPSGAFPTKAAANSTDHLMVPTALYSQTHSDAGSENTQAVPRPQARFKVGMKNQGAFDNVGPSQDSFLDPKKDWLYRSYRTAYSRLLSIWELPVQQSEVLKIGGVIESDSSYRRARASFSFPTFVRSDSEESTEDNPENRGLEIQRHCSRCGNSLQMSIFSAPPSIEASAEAKPSEGTSVTCPNCRPKQSLPISLPCVICGEVIEGMLIPCLNCGHVSCFTCHQAWFSKTSSQSGEDKAIITPGQEQEFRSCPSGCGCICSEHITVKIPVPWTSPTPNHSRERSLDRPRSGPADSSRLSGDLFPRDEQHEGDIEFWRASPFASLARGLGGGISRGFRKDDRRLRSKSTSSHSTLAFVPRRSAMNQVENT